MLILLYFPVLSCSYPIWGLYYLIWGLCHGSRKHIKRAVFEGAATCAGPYLRPSGAQLLHIRDYEKHQLGNGCCGTRAVAPAAQWIGLRRTYWQSKALPGKP